MIKSLKIEDYQDLTTCKALNYQSRESFLKCTYNFYGGNSYGIVSDFGCGSWGLVTCLGGRGSPYHSGRIFLDESEISYDELIKYSCFVSENVFSNVNSNKNLSTPKQCIEKALLETNQKFSVTDIKKIFQLSDNRFERPLDNVSSEIWLISLAINFAAGKDIYCYPWLNSNDISWFNIAVRCGVIDFLKSQGKLILVPSNQEKKIKKGCDKILKFDGGKLKIR